LGRSQTSRRRSPSSMPAHIASPIWSVYSTGLALVCVLSSLVVFGPFAPFFVPRVVSALVVGSPGGVVPWRSVRRRCRLTVGGSRRAVPGLPVLGLLPSPGRGPLLGRGARLCLVPALFALVPTLSLPLAWYSLSPHVLTAGRRVKSLFRGRAALLCGPSSVAGEIDGASQSVPCVRLSLVPYIFPLYPRF